MYTWDITILDLFDGYKISRGYFKRFNEDYDFCILNKFDQIYATSSDFSWSDANEFRKFCEASKYVVMKFLYVNILKKAVVMVHF